MDFYIIINTYKRPESFFRLISQIVEYAYPYKWRVCVYFDGCGWYFDGVVIPDGFKIVCEYRHGREKYYKLIQQGFKFRESAKYYLKIDDDMEIVPGFFDKCIEAWESIKDPNKLTLNLLRDQRTSMWGSGDPVDYNDKVLITQWTDMNFMCDEKFMSIMDDFELQPPPEWLRTSSGVARQITRHMRGVYFDDEKRKQVKFREPFGNMYQVKESLLIHGHHPSVMNPSRQEKLTNI